MARPRKNRVSEYAGLLGDELGIQLSRQLAKSIAETQKLYLEEIAKLRAEIRSLTRKVEALSQRERANKKLGRWVPGGPGRPPKDAAERIAAFESRSGQKKPTKEKGRKS